MIIHYKLLLILALLTQTNEDRIREWNHNTCGSLVENNRALCRETEKEARKHGFSYQEYIYNVLKGRNYE